MCVCVCVCVCVTENVEQRKGRRGCVCCVCVATNCKILAVGWYGKLPFWTGFLMQLKNQFLQFLHAPTQYVPVQ